MEHLKLSELQEWAERAAAGRSEQALPGHLRECRRCQNEYRFQLAMVRSLRMPSHAAPPSVKRMVMNRIVSPTRQGLALRLLSGGGRAVAMAAVLAVVFFALTMNFPGTPEAAKSGPATQVFGQLSSYYAEAKEFLTSHSDALRPPSERNGDGNRLVIMTLVVLGGLGLVDRFVIRRFVHLKL